jgi:hypothetical protein
MLGRTQAFSVPSAQRTPWGGIPGVLPPAVGIGFKGASNTALDVIPTLSNSRQAILMMQFNTRVTVLQNQPTVADGRNRVDNKYFKPSQRTSIGTHGGESFLRE